jgi:PKD repeat protein
VDFVVQGCLRRTPQRCEGQVPLSLTFLALIEDEVMELTWDVGDGSELESGLVVSHTYEQAGTYDVSLTARESGGTTSEVKRELVVVSKAPPGGRCSTDSHCAAGSCVCRESCPAPLDEGLCAYPCQDVCPGEPGEMACVDLSASGAGAAEPWRAQLCLSTCEGDADCARDGFSCRLAPSVTGWSRACLPPFPRSVGAPCLSATGTPDPSLCLGGMCLGVGASGYCTGLCKRGSCPPGTSCAQLAGVDIGPVCLARCPDVSCDADPLLGCEESGGSGDYAFELIESSATAGARYCSVKRCQRDSDCGMTGRCDASAGGYCVPAGDS